MCKTVVAEKIQYDAAFKKIEKSDVQKLQTVEYACVCVSVQSLSVKESDGYREETVTWSGCEAKILLYLFPDSRRVMSVCVREMCVVIHNTVGFVDAACWVNVLD